MQSDELIVKNMNLVYSRVYKLNKGRFDDDLAQEGMIGLILAARRFDRSKGVTFATFATSYIDGYIKTFLCFNRTAVKPTKKNTGKIKYVKVISYEQLEKQRLLLSSITAKDDGGISGVESEIYIAQLFNVLNDTEAEVINLCLDGLTYKEIKIATGYSHSKIYKIKKSVKAKFIRLKKRGEL